MRVWSGTYKEMGDADRMGVRLTTMWVVKRSGNGTQTWNPHERWWYDGVKTDMGGALLVWNEVRQ